MKKKKVLNHLDLYRKNMHFLKSNEPDVYKKILILETAIEEGLYDSKYDLEYLDSSYYDVSFKSSGSYLYGCNSIKKSREICTEIDLDAKSSIFKTFYDYSFDQDTYEIAKKSDTSECRLSAVGQFKSIIGDVFSRGAQLQMSRIVKFIFLGTGLGLHLQMIVDKYNIAVCLILEDDLELFRLSLFVTDYGEINKKTMIFFSVTDEDFLVNRKLDEFMSTDFLYNSFIKFCFFNESKYHLSVKVNSYMTNQSHLVYDYTRLLMNVSRPLGYINQGYKILNLIDSENMIFFQNKKVLILAGGPSLKNELGWIKLNQNKFFIISILRNIKLLEEYEIIPDMVVNIDEFEMCYDDFIFNYKNQDILCNCLFVGSTINHEKVVSSFSKENIFLTQMFFEFKAMYGSLTFPSVGEYALFLSLRLGAGEVYLIGLDLALADDGKTHADMENVIVDSNFDKSQDGGTYGMSLHKTTFYVRGNLRDNVKTTPVLNASVLTIDRHLKLVKNHDIKIFNLSDGSYLAGTIPMQSKCLEVDSFSILDKTNLTERLRNCLLEYASSFLSTDEVAILKRNYMHAVKFRQAIDKLDSFNLLNKYHYSNMLAEILTQIKLFRDNESLYQIVAGYLKFVMPFASYPLMFVAVSQNSIDLNNIKKVLLYQIAQILDDYQDSLSFVNDINEGEKDGY